FMRRPCSVVKNWSTLASRPFDVVASPLKGRDNGRKSFSRSCQAIPGPLRVKQGCGRSRHTSFALAEVTPPGLSVLHAAQTGLPVRSFFGATPSAHRTRERGAIKWVAGEERNGVIVSRRARDMQPKTTGPHLLFWAMALLPLGLAGCPGSRPPVPT